MPELCLCSLAIGASENVFTLSNSVPEARLVAVAPGKWQASIPGHRGYCLLSTPNEPKAFHSLFMSLGDSY